MTDITGTEGSDDLFFEGEQAQLTVTLINPYSGEEIDVDGSYNVNTATYDGLGGNDYLIMTNFGDALFLDDGAGNQLVANVEGFIAGEGGDVINLASSTILYGDTRISGGIEDDILWGNVGNDTIEGSYGNDHIDGGPGNDTIIGGAGDDVLQGGVGDDIYYISDGRNSGDGNDVIYDLSGEDTIRFTIRNFGVADLSFSRIGYDLEIDTGTIGMGTITILDQFAPGGDYAIEGIEFYGGATFDLSTLEINDAPVAQDDSFTGTEDTDVTGNVLFDNGNGADSDSNLDVLSVQAETVTTAAGGTVVLLASGDFTYTPAADFYGTDSFDYTVLDGFGGSDIGTVTLEIAPVNDAPVAQDDTFAGTEDTDVTGNVLGDNGNGADSDVDGDTLSVEAETITTAGGGSVVLLDDGTFTYTPATNFNGQDSFEYTLVDGAGGSDTATVTLDVAPVNDAPVAQDDTFTGTEDTDVTGNVLANDSDVDGDTLSVEAATITPAGGGSVELQSDGTFTYTPAANFNGQDSFDYTLVDGAGGSDVGTVAIDVEEDVDPGDGLILVEGTDRRDFISVIRSQDGHKILGEGGNDYLFGSQAADLIDGGNGKDRIFGNDGDDVLNGGEGKDWMYGGRGDDILTGGAGNDVLFGGSGADTFRFESIADGVDKIRDFNPYAGDKLDISDILQGFDPLTDALEDFVQITRQGSRSTLFVDADGGGDEFTALASMTFTPDLTDEAALVADGTLLIA